MTPFDREVLSGLLTAVQNLIEAAESEDRRGPDAFSEYVFDNMDDIESTLIACIDFLDG